MMIKLIIYSMSMDNISTTCSFRAPINSSYIRKTKAQPLESSTLTVSFVHSFDFRQENDIKPGKKNIV